jgi:hypothetical protein
VKGITNYLLLTIILIFSLTVKAQVSTVEGDGRFYSRDDDSLSFIKQQLLTNAFRDIFTKEMKEMGLDSDQFWRNYEEKFQQYFENVKTGLMAKHEVTEETAEKNADYQKALRHERLRLKARYGRISRAIMQHSIKKMSRSPQVPNSRYISVKAKVNRRELHKIYLSFTGNEENKHYSTLYISSDFTLVDTTWSEIGIEVETDFTDVLRNNWKDQITAAMTNKVDKVIFVDSAQTNELKKFSGLSLEIVKQVKMQSDENSMAAESTSKDNVREVTDAISMSNDYASSIWLKINFKIKKIRENENAQKRTFEVSGDLFLQDLSSQKVVFFTDFDEFQNSYSYEDPKVMSNGLANAIYQVPLGSFKSFPRSLESAKTSLKRVTLEVSEYTNMSDLVNLTKFLSDKGVTKQFSPMIKSFDAKNAKILLEYSGEDQDMVTMLKSLSGMNIDQTSQLYFPSADNPFQVVVKKVEAEEENLKGGTSQVSSKRKGNRT